MIGVAAGLSAGTLIGYYFVSKSHEDQRLERLATFRDRRKIILRDIVYKTGAVNALILKIHNGGSELTEGTPWYSSVIDEAPTFSDVSAIDSWQNRAVDKPYRDLIRTIKENKMHWVLVESMPDSFLKRTYQRMGIIGSLVVNIYTDDHFFYYASFPVRENFESLTDSAELNKYEVCQTHLRRLYEKYHNLGVLEMDWTFPANATGF